MYAIRSYYGQPFRDGEPVLPHIAGNQPVENLPRQGRFAEPVFARLDLGRISSQAHQEPKPKGAGNHPFILQKLCHPGKRTAGGDGNNAVITSYSIHYTKLYDKKAGCRVASGFGRETAAKVAAGVTGANFAIADTGTLVLESTSYNFV